MLSEQATPETNKNNYLIAFLKIFNVDFCKLHQLLKNNTLWLGNTGKCKYSPWLFSLVLREIYVAMLFIQDKYHAVVTCAPWGEGLQVVTHHLTCTDVTLLNVPSVNVIQEKKINAAQDMCIV